MSNKVFIERLNQQLDEIGIPKQSSERVEALAKLLHIPRVKAELLLSGSTKDLVNITKLADEFEVKLDWLLGNSNKH